MPTSRLPSNPFSLTPLANAFKALACSGLLCMPMVSMQVYGQATSASQSDTTLAGERQYQIPAGSLTAVLTRFASESGLFLVGASEAAAGKTSAGLNGIYSVNDGLSQVLAGSGLTFRFSNDNTVTLEKAAAGSPITLAPIRVKGELQERNLQDTQTSVAVVSGEMLEQRSDPNIYNLIERLPGVTKFNDGEFSIRGTRQRGPSASRGNSRLVQVSVDGATISNFEILTWRGPYSTWDLDQVEVLRGPQSTQSGRNALAGAIVLRSNDPSYEQEFKARGELGTDTTWGTSFAYNQPILDNTLAVRASADIRKSDGFITNTTLGDEQAGKTETQTYRLGLAWDPSEAFSAVLKFARHEDEAGQPLVQHGTYETDLDVPKFVDTNSNTLNLRMDYTVSPSLSLQSETAYLTADVFQTDDGDRTSAPAIEFIRDRTADTLEQQLKLFYQSEQMSGVVGIYYLDYDQNSVTAGSFFGTSFTIVDPTQVTNTAIFGEVELNLFEQVRLIVGARYDDEEFDTESISSLAGGVPVVLEGTYDAFLPKLGVVYEFSDDVSLGLTYQEAYRAGGAVNNPELGDVPFEPEFTDNFELALRSQFFDRRLTFNANAFFIDWTDQQIGRGETFEEFVVVNAGESEQYGAEIDLQWQPNADWDLFASLAYVSTEFIDFVDRDNDFSGNEFPAAPTWTASLGATYFFDERWYVSADGSFTDRSFVEADNTLEHDSRFLVNLRAGYEADNWDLFIYARNLFDKYYLTDTFANGETFYGRVGEPLTAGLVLNYRY